MNKRRGDVSTVAQFYTRKFRWYNKCVYCGDQAYELDHVFPVVFSSQLDLTRPGVRKELGQGLSVVPSCAECNRLAGKTPFTLIAEKRKYIQGKLRKKHKKLLKGVVWDLDELDGMGPAMRRYIMESMAIRWTLTQRVMWPAAPKTLAAMEAVVSES